MLDDVQKELATSITKAHEALKRELTKLRAGRANPSLLDNIRVDYYGTPTPMKSIASIAVPEATQLMIKPFSPGDMKAIEKAISDSKLGLTPHSDGRALYLKLPPLSQERRLQLVGSCKQAAEAAKIAIRNARRDANKVLETEQKGGVLTEDEASGGKDQVQELTKTYETKADEMIEKKKNEIMQV